ncbi:MAG: helix-hairpin-helix domain-containing protein [Pyrinomonadaceae bacterium]
MSTNLQTILLTIILFICVFWGGCSSRIVYEQPEVHSNESALNINTATATDLEKLPYIGRKTAEAIVEFRQANGPFRRVEHIMQIRGISEKRFIELRPFLITE